MHGNNEGTQCHDKPQGKKEEVFRDGAEETLTGSEEALTSS